jgi:hypothetical protein
MGLNLRFWVAAIPNDKNKLKLGVALVWRFLDLSFGVGPEPRFEYELAKTLQLHFQTTPKLHCFTSIYNLHLNSAVSLLILA